MKNFKIFLTKLFKNPSTATTLEIKGIKKKIKGMSRYTTFNLGGNGYIKITFQDHSFLLILIDEQELYYASKIIGHIKEIADEEIGVVKKLHYKGKDYVLDNINDYQYVNQLYVGTPLEIEGEVRFSDYFPVSGQKEFLSIGWHTRTGERADINPHYIDLSEVDIIE